MLPRPAPDADPGTGSPARFSPRWNGLPRCVPTSRTGASRWCVTTDTTATSPGGNARRKAAMTSFPVSSNTCDYGSQEQGRRPKSMPRLSACTAQASRLPRTSWMTSRRSPSMTIHFMGILNTHGTITSKRNASKNEAYRRGLPEKNYKMLT
jgi:hypothetical protein